MAAQPACPLVLSLLAVAPQRAPDVARRLARIDAGLEAPGHAVAVVALHRLRDAGLVRRRPARGGPLYELTARGRRELALQRGLRVAALRAAGRAA